MYLAYFESIHAKMKAATSHVMQENGYTNREKM